MTGAIHRRWWLSIALTLVLTTTWWWLSPERLEQTASLFLGLFVVAACLPLAWRVGLLMLAGVGALNLGLSFINQAKIAMTQAPLTTLDFATALANPLGLWIALGWAPWTRYLTAIALAGVGSGWVWLVARTTWRHLRSEASASSRARAVAASGLAIVGLASFAFALPPRLASHANDNDDLWEASALGAYSSRIGPLPFLLYSRYLEQRNTGPFYAASTVPPPSAEVVSEAATRYVTLSPQPRTLPNIVVVFAESTFNPDWAFSLAAPVASPLFARQRDTHTISGLYVNAVGGGSWITEFESIVGIDSRVFGYSGYYTHATLSPFVRRSFATYLRSKGYDTAAYYSWGGDFYNARRAYANYGFERFLDVEELGLQPFQGSDVDIAKAAIVRMKDVADRPSFSYLVLYENHAPHRCEHFTQRTPFRTVFAGATEFRKNCELNEYLRRMRSTSQAVEAVDTYLRDVERSTGRPYALVTFGDHQPHTFAGTKSPPLSNFDYSAQRTPASARETFLHIRSSMGNPLHCCAPEAPPAFLLPTLMSAYVASSPDDLYLPENLHVYQQCGSEILLGGHMADAVDLFAGAVAPRAHPECLEAYRGWLAAMRGAGVL